MSEISKERAQEIFLGNGPEPTAQEERALARIALDWLALRERAEPVAYPAPQDASLGWKIDPEFINKVQESIGYDDECECWEGTPSMEMVEAVLLAASKLNTTPAPVVPDDDQARQAYENHVRSRYQYPMLERHPEDGGSWHGEYKESARQMEWEDWLHSWNACLAAMLAAPTKN